MVTASLPMATGQDGVPLPQQLARLDLARLKAYRENLEFYRGFQWAEAQRRRERRLTFNYAKAIIEKAASYVMGGLNLVVDPLDTSAEEQERARRGGGGPPRRVRVEQPGPAGLR